MNTEAFWVAVRWGPCADVASVRAGRAAGCAAPRAGGPQDLHSSSLFFPSGRLWRDHVCFFFPFLSVLLNSISKSPPIGKWFWRMCFKRTGFNAISAQNSVCVETPPQATPLSLLPSLLPFPFHLGSFSFAAHGLRLEVSAAGVGSVKSSVTHLVVTIYCIFYLFSVTDLLIYRMVQMFWHNYFGLHYLFMMLFFFFCHCLLYIWNDKWCTCWNQHLQEVCYPRAERFRLSRTYSQTPGLGDFLKSVTNHDANPHN